MTRRVTVVALLLLASAAYAQSDKIVYSKSATGTLPSDIFMMDPDGTHVQNLTSDLGDAAMKPRISPDGRRISFNTVGANGRLQVWVMNVDGTGKRQLTNLNQQYGPENWDWLDNYTILYRHAPGPSQGDVYALDIRTGTARQLLRASALGQASIDWCQVSPDGSTLVLVAQAGSWSPSTDVYLANADGSNVRPFYIDSPDNFISISPVWLNNRHIVWAQNTLPGVSYTVSFVQKSRLSANPVSQHDGIVRPGNAAGGIAVSASPDGLHLLLQSGATLLVRDLETGQETTLIPSGMNDGADWGRINPLGCLADVDDGSGTGNPDGGITIDDLLYYLQRFELGC